jgi:hypothetical protein
MADQRPFYYHLTCLARRNWLTYVEFGTMTMRENQLRDLGPEPSLRIPQATFASLMSYLKSLGREDLQKPLVCPPGTDSRTWAQIHASLTALGLLQNDQGTLVLRRIVAGETSLLDVIESRFGAEVVAAIECGASCSVGLLADLHREKSNSTIFRFESLVRMAIKDRGRHPVRRQSKAPVQQSETSATTSEAPSANSVELALFELEGQHLAKALGDRLDKGDLSSAREIRAMLRDLHDQLKRLS